MPPILVAEDVRVSYGAVEALKGVSLSLEEGDIVAVLGANGAGKTTLLKAISRILPLTSGVIKFRGEDMRKYPPFRLPSLG
ncbi:MAG TPA: ATP-binding cassette domain-containing protein, partial [Synergistaceae bacterium]|nr:ATP-binding cassette domain-containing protein [Synergistaceae bacterium]